MTRPLIVLLIYLTTSIALGITTHPLFFMMLILPFIFNVIDLISHDFTTSNLIFGIFFLGKTKRVYTQYGRFYIIIKNDYTCLFQDKIFWLKYIDYTSFKNIDQVKDFVKSNYDTIYRVKKSKDEVMEKIKEWNGYIDIQTERDRKLDKIL